MREPKRESPVSPVAAMNMDLQKHIADHVRDIPHSGIRDFFDIVQSMKRRHLARRRRARFRHAVAHPRGGDLLAGTRAHPLHLEPRPARAARRDRRIRRANTLAVAYDPRTEVHHHRRRFAKRIDLALRALLNPGDEVLYHEPCYVSYAPSVDDGPRRPRRGADTRGRQLPAHRRSAGGENHTARRRC